MNQEIQELLRRYESGEATPQERALVETWYDQLNDLPHTADEAEYERVFNDLDQRMHELHGSKPEISPLKLRRLQPRKFWRQAAIWTGIILSAGALTWKVSKSFQQEQTAYVEKTNPSGAPVKYRLPDSSTIYLGAGSSVKYPVQFAGNKREMELKGEAFFEVKHLTDKPFIIHTGDVNTQVLGTSFKVRTFGGQQTVAVATGKVGVTEHHGNTSQTLGMLTPGQQISWNGVTKKATKGTIDIYSLEQWRDGGIIFDDEELAQVAADLQRRFKIDIQFADEEVRAYHVSSTFSANEPVSKILNILSVLGKFRYERINDHTYQIHKTE